MVSALRRVLSNGKEMKQITQKNELRSKWGTHRVWMEYGINVFVCPFLGFLLDSLGNRRADQGMGPSLSISTSDTSFDIYIWHISTFVTYLIFVPFFVSPRLNYINYIHIIKYLNWVYMIFSCLLGIPKLSLANLASLLFCMCGNCIRVL